MAEVRKYHFDYKEIAEALIKKQGIHEGLWGIYMEFGIGAGIIPGPSENTVLPAALIPVTKVGIQRFDKPNALAVDAAVVNPLPTESSKPSGKAQKIRKSKEGKGLKRSSSPST